MGRFNLLDEPWISVLSNKTGEKKDVSMLDFFRDAGSYQSFAGEMETQNFAVMRFLLSVVQTVFSRFDYNGNVLPGIYINDMWVQTEPLDAEKLEDSDDYSDAVTDCWNQLYRGGYFPDIIIQYLEKWRNYFFLFDDEHPFYQVNKKEMDEIMAQIPQKSNPTTVYGKSINRTISESENKTALFSPVAAIGIGKRTEKDVMTEAELVRWLIMFQGYSGLADKVSLANEKQRSSKGWLFDLGGIFLQGNNVFETMIMNYIPESPSGNQKYNGKIQRPCWEADGEARIKRLCQGSFIDNLAEIYTNWSRAVYIDPKTDLSEPVKIEAVKLPEIEHTETSIEPMTLWRWNDNGPNKNKFTPKKHSAEQSLWRSFGIITMKSSTEGDEKRHQPGIFEQYKRLKEAVGSRWTDLVGVSMEDDGNATSWLPVDEIFDSFHINDLVITDSDPNGWIIRINDAVETTKEVVSGIFRGYLIGICEIRNLKVTNPMDSYAAGFIMEETAKLYAVIDTAFKDWLASIKPEDSKENVIKAWYSILRKMVLTQGEELYRNSTVRDLKGIEKETGIENIATKYQQFVYRINRKLGKGGEK